MLLDSHTHIQELHDKSVRDAIFSKASQPGVGRLFINAIRPTDWDLVKSLSEKYHAIVPFFGIHPWFIEKIPDGWEDMLKRYLDTPNACVGEIGLDKKRKGIDFEAQKSIFSRQIAIAAEKERPFNIHCVEAWGTILEILKSNPIKTPFIVHFFSGSREILSELLDMGAYVSFSARSLEGPSEKPKEALLETPLDRLLLETDFPYIGKDNPTSEDYFSYLEKSYDVASKLKGINRELLESCVWENGSVFTD